MKVKINANDLKEEKGKVKRVGIFDDRGVCVKICFNEEEAKGLAEKWSVPQPFGFADEHIDYTYKEIWI